VIEDETVYLLSIYDKSEQGDISNKELQELLKQIPLNKHAFYNLYDEHS